jgi:PAS domain S-box-containing protein
MMARWLLGHAFGDRFFFITFYPAVMIAAYFGGLRPGLLATALSTLVVDYALLPPTGSVALSRRTDWVAVLFFAFNGIIISAFSEALHATRRRATDHANRAFELSHMLEATLDLVALSNTKGEIVYMNRAGRRLIGVGETADLSALKHERLCPPWVYEQTEREWMPMALRDGVASGEGALLSTDGREIPVSFVMHIHRNPAGEVELISTIAHDLTDRKRMEAERDGLLLSEQQARLLAEAANRQKDDFLAVLSHELRTPMTAIIGWSSLLKGRKLDPEAAVQAVEVIHRNAKAQMQMIEDLLDVSRIVSGKLSLDRQPVELSQVIAAVMDAVRPMAEAKQITLTTSGDVASVVMGDPSRLQQVFMNLLTNAVKFTPKGGRVSVRFESGEQTARVTVEDTGEGISADFFPFLFERFRQADSSYTRKHAGLGLGLAIARHLVELHGGTVAAASAGVGQGSAFTITLPLGLAQEMSESLTARETTHAGDLADEKRPLAGIKVLIVDDDKDTREVMHVLLGQYGAETLTAASAAEALSTLRAWRPDLLLSDLGMPGEDGYALIRRIRSLPHEEGGGTPAVALTGYASEEESDRVHQAGFQAHQAKPVEGARLVETLVSLAKVISKRDGA